MPPREELLGESQPLMSSSPPELQEDEILQQQQQREEEAEWNDGSGSSGGGGNEYRREQQQQEVSRTFWQAVQERRDYSDQEAARDVEILSKRQRNKCSAIAFGQLIAFILASTNMASYTLENSFGILAPNFMLFCMYTLLTFHLFFRSTRRDYHQPSDDANNAIYKVPILGLRILIPWYIYFFVSLIDVGAGIIMLISLQYTSLTSVTLLTSLTVPSTMIFSNFLLSKSFHKHHVLGVCLCLVGGCLTIWSDLDQKQDNINDSNGFPGNTTTNNTAITTTTSHNAPTFLINWGDLLAVTAALLYGFGDAVSEYAVKHIDRMEFLGMLGFFGMVLTGIQFPFEEGEVLSTLFFGGDTKEKLGAILLMASYVMMVLLYYVTEASFLVNSDATLLNLSLQAQNLWAILFAVFANQAAPPLLFYLALVLVIIGVFVYEVGGPSSDPVLHLVEVAESEVETVDPSSLQTEHTSRPCPRDRHQDRRQGRGVQYDSLQQIEIT